MTDLVEMLRRHAHHSGLFELAADEISRLLKELDYADLTIEIRGKTLEKLQTELNSWKGLSKQFGNELDALKERRCEICGYAEHHREHTGCLRTENATLRADFDALNELLRATCEELDALKSTPPVVPDGWVLVPVEPTEQMFREMVDPFIAINGDNRKAFCSAYRGMLAAAPKQGEAE